MHVPCTGRGGGRRLGLLCWHRQAASQRSEQEHPALLSSTRFDTTAHAAAAPASTALYRCESLAPRLVRRMKKAPQARSSLQAHAFTRASRHVFSCCLCWGKAESRLGSGPASGHWTAHHAPWYSPAHQRQSQVGPGGNVGAGQPRTKQHVAAGRRQRGGLGSAGQVRQARGAVEGSAQAGGGLCAGKNPMLHSSPANPSKLPASRT